MRKKSKRTLRPVAKPLTAKQKADIVIAPRMHLQMLLAGQYDVDYACSLAGVFNLSGVLSHMYERNDLEQTFDLAQEIIVCLIREGRAPTGDEGQSLAEAFNLADAWITMQNTVSLMKAVDYMDRELAKKDRLGDVNAVGRSAR
ncbi:MAG: hypothetical protein CVU33_04445 [Betaproteobacteria bacterium HGW-Betaproteobacteria-6]|jgi:plasmid maintenance system antidote protein VapI|nr:MAG: hypothetical protein CVU33_04445 [Betaproteobacteria bacterium HGW-Betaproteobacteria-6]